MTMANLVHEPARLYPDKDALRDGQRSCSFGELERLSTNFAGFLLARGVRGGDRIAFCAAKTTSLVIAILGCWKAGAIYVPVDRKLPKDRLLFILNDVGPRFIVAGQALYDAIAPDLAAPSTLIDDVRLADHCHDPGAAVSLPDIAGDDVAYCIYTSGSTGRPKGVLIQHRSVEVFYRALAEVMTIGPGSRCMNTSELYFDVHVMDLFFPLHRGATVQLSGGPLIANKLLQTIATERITHFTAVGPVMTLMTEGSLFETCDLSSLVRVMTGAEIINVDTMQRWLRRVPGLTIVNGYGPTEATVICTSYLIDRVEPGRSEFYPIGKPMIDTEVLLVDDGRIVSEPGVSGELMIGGPQVMKGYWNDDRQTAAKTTVIAGKRYYRSGDVCRWRPDGNLDYVGRNDDEIKLSGFRINLNEIKRVIDATPCVKEGHPVVTVHPTLGKLVVACFTRADGEVVNDDLFGRLQAVFKHELPYYMVPSLYFAFDRFPTMPSGKTDKKAILQRVEQGIRDAEPGATRFVCAEAPAPEPGPARVESPERWFHQRATLYVETQILFHLNQVGVWNLLRGGGPLTALQVAESLRLEPRVTDALLDYVFEVDDLLDRDPDGRYSLSGFGKQVIQRFSDAKSDTGQQTINMFDVRVGAYGPVWHNLGKMLSGEARYGQEFHREGRYAENGVFKLAMRFWDSLIAHVEEIRPASMVEVGVTTGLVERLAETYPDRQLYGLDRSGMAIERGSASAAAKQLNNLRWIQSDYFDPDGWTKPVDASRRGLLYSLHFHELIAGGEARFVDVLRRLRTLLPGWVVLAFEQPRLPRSDKPSTPETQWLYSQSNILIHHLIGNGRILSSETWNELGRRAGCRQVTDRACHYLGYRAFAFHL